MSKVKSTRTWIATFVAMCLLFAQMATAAYACPQWNSASSAQRAEAVAVMVDCDSMPVSQMDKEQPSLCKAHCQSSQQSHESKSTADVQVLALDILWSVVWILQPELESTALVVSENATSVRPPGSPSLYLVNQVFRL